MNIDQFVQELGIDKLAPEAQDQIMLNVYRSLHRRIGERFLEGMSQGQLKQYVELSKRDPQAAIDLLLTWFPNYDAIVQEEIYNLKDDVQALMPSAQTHKIGQE